MNLKEIGYYLYMEEEEKKKKDLERKLEEVNLNARDLLEGEERTTRKNKNKKN